jgi:multicomponent Na+:H+ antiporter subunit A
MAEKANQPKFDMLAYGIAAIPALIFVFVLTFLPVVISGGNATGSYSWVPSLGIKISYLVDGLSLLFGLIITLIGTLVILYAGSYLAGKKQLGRFYSFIIFFMLAMLGVVFSRDLLSLFIFWELTSISSFLLIGYYHEKEASRKAALQALLVTGGGGLAMLAGFLLLGMTAESYDLPTIFSQAEAIQANSLYPAILILVLLGAFTKSAQFPFHFWLPGAMEAPAPVSAYLHSATMVKAGIYLIARLTPALGGTALWTSIIVPVGAITMILSAIVAMHQTDLKRILAYSTVSVLGMLTFLLGFGTGLAIKAAVVLIIAHALYKGTLFLAAGAVDHETGTRDILQLGGLRKYMPITALAVGLAALSQAGLPPLFGFISKELLYEVTLAAGSNGPLWTGVALLTSVFLVAVAGVVAIRPFFGKFNETPNEPHEAPWQMTLGPIILASTGLLFGLFPGWTGNTIVAPAVASILGEPYKVKLALWHGVNPMLILSIITILLGIGLYALQKPARKLIRKLDPGPILGPGRLYQLSWKGIEWFAQFQTRILQNGSLQNYLLTVILAAVILIGLPLIEQTVILQNLGGLGELRLHEIAIAAIILVASIAVVRARSRLAAVAALGVVGFGVAMIYIFYGAPDLAMTQFSIETLTVILFVLVLYRLPRFAIYSGRLTRFRDALVAIAGGVMMTTLVLVVTSTPLLSRLTPYFAENSYTLAKGRNIVNVILVDFRGIDTLGEIVVLAVAATGVYALMKLRDDKTNNAEE